MDNEKVDTSYLENKGYFITANQFKNLMAFLSIMLGDKVMELVDKSPDYILEKYIRYVGPIHHIHNNENHKWGVHPVLREQFLHKYYKKWGTMLDWPLSDLLGVL